MDRLALTIVAFVRFNFDWMIICAVAIGLSVANVVGYTKCSSDAKSKAQLAQVGTMPVNAYAPTARVLPAMCACIYVRHAPMHLFEHNAP